MSITTASGRVLVEFDVNSIIGAPAVGAYVLKISLNYSIPPQDEETYYHKTSAKIYVGKKELYLGIAFPEQPVTFRSHTHTQKAGLLYEMLLSKNAIEEVEKLRSGEELDFKIEITGEYVDGINQLCSSETLRYKSSHTEWISVLKAMSFKGGLVFELPMDIRPSEDVTTALAAIDKAKVHLYYGNYDDVVAKCRISLESIISNWGHIRDVNEQIKKDKKAMSKEQRFFHAINQIVHFAHLSHHPDENDDYISFTRSEAVFVLGATISAVSSYAERKI